MYGALMSKFIRAQIEKVKTTGEIVEINNIFAFVSPIFE